MSDEQSPPASLAAMLVKGMPSKDGGGDAEGGGDDAGETQAAQEMMDAMKSGDAASFTTSLKSFVEMCMAKY